MADTGLQRGTAGSVALDEAAALVTAGRSIDAIRVLTAANRAQPDARLEQRLVSLRHDAFATLDRRPPAPLPAPITATTATPGELPELSPADLTPETLRSGLATHGCVRIKQLIAPDRAQELANGIDRTLDAFDAGAEGAPVSETTPWYAPFTPDSGNYRVGGRRGWVRASGGVWTVDSPRMLVEVTRLLDETGVGEVVTRHLGERPALSANKCTLRRVPIDSNTDWHQDGAFLGEQVRTVNLWLALSDCGVDAPGLDIVPRRLDHVAETGTEGAFFDWSVSPTVVESLSASAPVIRPRFAPGDALLFDHLLLHRTAVGPEMTRERHAIETWLFAPSTYPDGQIPIVY
jgi:hypothetical protein